jgi:hypothetical protein
LRTFNSIEEGVGGLTIVGELESVPSAWRGVYNIRLSIPIDIRKDLPNNTPILFQSASLIQSSLVVSESVDFDSNDVTYNRSMINISASNLETFGGQLRFIEVSYNEARANTDKYKLLTTYEASASGEEYEITSSDAVGLNPVSNLFKTPMPRDLRRSGDVTFRLRFFNGANQVVQDPTTGNEIMVSASATFEGTPIIIEKDDNLLTGSLGVGNAVGTGFEMAGKRSAYLRTAGYSGFTSASAASGSGVLIWSGSVLDKATDDYSLGGVGLELVADSSSYFRFRTNPKELDIRADAFFVGNVNQQFISGAGANIEISSSGFHLDTENNSMVVAGWKLFTGDDGRSLLSGSNITLDATGSSLYMSDKGPRSDTTYPAGFEPLADEYYIDFSPSGSSDSAGYYVHFGPNFSVNHEGILLASGAKFIGTITASAGLIGGWSIEDTYIGSVPDGMRLYGNSSDSSYHISSSNFKVTTQGDITGSQVLFTGGKIAGATISDTELKYGSNWSISASAQDNEYFISSSKFNVKQSGDVTGSQVLFTGGKIAGATIADDKLSYSSNWSISASAQDNEPVVKLRGLQLMEHN